MTKTERLYRNMHLGGCRVTEIAAIFGKSKGNVSSTLKRAREGATVKRKMATPIQCEHCPSCFECPLGDCVVQGVYINPLPTDYIFLGDIYDL